MVQEDGRMNFKFLMLFTGGVSIIPAVITSAGNLSFIPFYIEWFLLLEGVMAVVVALRTKPSLLNSSLERASLRPCLYCGRPYSRELTNCPYCGGPRAVKAVMV
jgi:hypothetical protein